jgi:hypothetical protein
MCGGIEFDVVDHGVFLRVVLTIYLK